MPLYLAFRPDPKFPATLKYPMVTLAGGVEQLAIALGFPPGALRLIPEAARFGAGDDPGGYVVDDSSGEATYIGRWWAGYDLLTVGPTPYKESKRAGQAG